MSNIVTPSYRHHIQISITILMERKLCIDNHAMLILKSSMFMMHKWIAFWNFEYINWCQECFSLIRFVGAMMMIIEKPAYHHFHSFFFFLSFLPPIYLNRFFVILFSLNHLGFCDLLCKWNSFDIRLKRNSENENFLWKCLKASPLLHLQCGNVATCHFQQINSNVKWFRHSLNDVPLASMSSQSVNANLFIVCIGCDQRRRKISFKFNSQK